MEAVFESSDLLPADVRTKRAHELVDRFSSPSFRFESLEFSATESSTIVLVTATGRNVDGELESITSMTTYVMSFDFGRPDPGWRIGQL